MADNDLVPNAPVYTEPPRFSTIRVNTLVSDVEAQDDALKRYLGKLGAECRVLRHASLPELLVVESAGRRPLAESGRRLVVDTACGAAVLRGADVYAPGVLACPAGLMVYCAAGQRVCCAQCPEIQNYAQAGDDVSVYADLEGRCLRGRTQPYEGRQIHVGNGVMHVSRHAIFTAENPRGVAVRLTSPLFGAPSLGPFCGAAAFLQNLPSVLAARVLDPQPGELVLDMCAAPGGKATHVAQLMRNQGLIIAVDKTAPKVARICCLASQQQITCIRAVRGDSTRNIRADSACRLRERHLSGAACPHHGPEPCAPPFPPETFDRVLLDAPCSGLGQRPRLSPPPLQSQLDTYPPLQRRLLAAGVAALRNGGTIVYSTCTLPVEENERQVAAALAAFPQMALVSTEPRLGGPGLSGYGLTEEHCRMVQRFAPRPELGTCDSDTIGFFLAKLVKNDRCEE